MVALIALFLGVLFACLAISEDENNNNRVVFLLYTASVSCLLFYGIAVL